MKGIIKSYLGISILNLRKDRKVWEQDLKVDWEGMFDGMEKKACRLQQGRVSHSPRSELKDQKPNEIPNQNSTDGSINYRLTCSLYSISWYL